MGKRRSEVSGAVDLTLQPSMIHVAVQVYFQSKQLSIKVRCFLAAFLRIEELSEARALQPSAVRPLALKLLLQIGTCILSDEGIGLWTPAIPDKTCQFYATVSDGF